MRYIKYSKNVAPHVTLYRVIKYYVNITRTLLYVCEILKAQHFSDEKPLRQCVRSVHYKLLILGVKSLFT